MQTTDNASYAQLKNKSGIVLHQKMKNLSCGLIQFQVTSKIDIMGLCWLTTNQRLDVKTAFKTKKDKNKMLHSMM